MAKAEQELIDKTKQAEAEFWRKNDQEKQQQAKEAEKKAREKGGK